MTKKSLVPSLLIAARIIYRGFLLLIFWLNQTQAMAAQLGYWLTHTVVFAWMDSWSKCQYCCMLLWSSVTIIKFENHYCYHTQNKSKNNNKFSKNDKKVRTDNFSTSDFEWLSDLVTSKGIANRQDWLYNQLHGIILR